MMIYAIIGILVVFVGAFFIFIIYSSRNHYPYTSEELCNLVYPMAYDAFSHCASVNVGNPAEGVMVIEVEPRNPKASPLILVIIGNMISFQGPYYGTIEYLVKSCPLSEEDVAVIKNSFKEVKSGKKRTGCIMACIYIVLPIKHYSFSAFEPYE